MSDRVCKFMDLDLVLTLDGENVIPELLGKSEGVFDFLSIPAMRIHKEKEKQDEKQDFIDEIKNQLIREGWVKRPPETEFTCGVCGSCGSRRTRLKHSNDRRYIMCGVCFEETEL